jgi:methyl-galactoside transport system ATP-binding protein
MIIQKIFDRLGIDIDPRVKAGTLTVSQRQMIEIAKAVSYEAKVIVMDEPTSSLTENEVEHLFRIIEQLKAQKTSFIYISHKMEEIKRISDDITIMRDGKWITTEPVHALTTDMIIKMMVGRELKERYPKKETKPGEVLLKVQQLSSLNQEFHGVNFQLHKGEILGISGLVGSKRTKYLKHYSVYGPKDRGRSF